MEINEIEIRSTADKSTNSKVGSLKRLVEMIGM